MLYYVHYVGFNKRLDEWVPPERIDFTRIMLPKIKSNNKQQDTVRKKPILCANAGVQLGAASTVEPASVFEGALSCDTVVRVDNSPSTR